MKKITLALAALFVMVGMSRADNWMKHLPDGEYVANVSIPGTHDSATGNGLGRIMGLIDGTDFAQTQELTLSEQWAIGIRAYDLRPCVTEDNYLNVNHGIVPTDIGFEEAMTILRDSLIANPSEFIVIHLLHETDGEWLYSGDSDFQTLLHNVLESDGMKDYLVDFRQNLTVADMRGKMLILYRDSYSTNPVGGMMTGWCGWIDWNVQTQGKITAGKGSGSYTSSKLYMQDQSDTHEDGMVEKKVEAIKTMLDYTTTHYYTSPSSIVWVYNFASAYAEMEGIHIGSLIDLDFSTSDGYRLNATSTNKAIADYLAEKSGPTGIILADYVGVDEVSVTTGGIFGFGGTTTTYETMGLTLINGIVENNWEYIDYLDGGEEALNAAVKEAEALDVSTNVGTGVFEVPQSYATAVTNAIAAGKALLDGSYHSETAYYEAVEAINEAVEAFNSATLNEPAEGELFNITLSASGNSYDGYAVTFVEDAGSYELLFAKDIAPVYGQAFTFTHQATTDKPNGYTISFTDVDGKTRYLCNGSGQGISTTTTASSAFVYEVVPASTKGTWNLYNSNTSSNVGCTDGALASSASASTLVFSDTEAVSVSTTLSDDWGTLILPFTANVPNGLTVYSCSGAEKGVLSLTEETTIAANTPYILNGKGTYTFTGTGTYHSGYSLTAGLLTGTILGTTVSEGAYVLDTQDGVQAFYAVASSTSLVAYTCYLSGDELTADVYTFPGYDSAKLREAIENAEGKDITTNVGTGVFLIPESYATAVTNAIAAGEALLDGTYHSETAYSDAVDAINEAVDAFDNATLNEPAEGELFNITLSASGNSCDGYAVTFVEDAGSYELLFTKDIDPVYGQAFTFTPSEEKANGYVISFTDVDGETRYLCNGSGQSISTTTTASSAFVYEVVITSQENVWNLYNSETNSYVGCTDGTLANSASASTLVFSDTEAMSVSTTLNDEWGTLILPFTANVPNGLTVYSCSGAEKGVLSLTEETTIVANTPYILNGKGTYTFTGTGTYYSGYSLTAGLLTGTILGTTVSEGAYVLDTQDGVQAFYAVASSTSLAAYTCYLSGDELTEDVYGFTGYDTATLEAAIENAESKDITTNVGTGVFLIPESYATAVTEAIAAGKALLENDILTEEECQEAIDAINEAVEAFNSATLNEPAEGELFNITLSASGNSCDGYAVTFVEDAGSYELLFTKDIDPVYGQAFTFTPREEKANGYVISFTDVDGETRYLCNGSGQSISTTTTASSAFVYEVVITSQENVWNLYNSETNSYVGCTDGALASSASASTLVFSDTEAVAVDIELSYDWGTLILPLAASVPEGMTVYSCTATDEDEGEVVLTAEASIVANTPYIVNGKGTYTFEGTGAYYSGYSLTSGLLTGTILGSTVPEGAYVLADQGEGQAFYIVTEADTSLLPYSCYITVETSDEGAESRTFYNLPGGTVAVKAVEADVEGNASKAFYDMQGRQVTTPRRGIYIRGGEKVLVK